MVEILCTAGKWNFTFPFMCILEGKNRSEKHVLLEDKIEYYAKGLLPNNLNNLQKICFFGEVEIHIF